MSVMQLRYTTACLSNSSFHLCFQHPSNSKIHAGPSRPHPWPNWSKLLYTKTVRDSAYLILFAFVFAATDTMASPLPLDHRMRLSCCQHFGFHCATCTKPVSVDQLRRVKRAISSPFSDLRLKSSCHSHTIVTALHWFWANYERKGPHGLTTMKRQLGINGQGVCSCNFSPESMRRTCSSSSE